MGIKTKTEKFQIKKYFGSFRAELKMIKVERLSNDGIKKRRPGRLPARPDEDLNVEEFEKRVLRRERNRLAASRCRQRRFQKMETLQITIAEIQDTNFTFPILPPEIIEKAQTESFSELIDFLNT